MGQIQNLEDLLNFIARRGAVMAVLAIIGIVGAAIYAKRQPDVFQTAAVIQVQGAQIGTGSSGSAQMLQSIEQRLTTREALLELIATHGLYIGLPLTDDEKAALLRRSISFEGIQQAGIQTYGEASELSAIIITAQDSSAITAAAIANDLAQRVLDLATEGQLATARDTLSFFTEEQARLTEQVTALETEIADYKLSNAEALPDEAPSRRTEVSTVETELRALEQDIVALAEEQRRLSAREDLRATDQRRLEEIGVELAVLNEQKAALIADRTSLQATIARMPEVEKMLSGLERQLDHLQANLASVAGKLGDAERELRLAERQEGERLAMLDRAITPLHPTGASGRKLFAVGALASIVVALGIALLLEMLRPIVRTSTQMERQLGLRPVIALPELDLPQRTRR